MAIPKVPEGMKFIGSYLYREHTHTYYRAGTKLNDPVVVYIDDVEWSRFNSERAARTAAINYIKREG